MAVGQAHQALHVFVDHQNGLALLAQGVEALPDFLADQRCQAFGGFVEDDEVRVGHECAAQCQHLLLTTRQLVAHVAAALQQAREQVVHPVQRPRRFGAVAVRSECAQVFFYRQVGKYLPAFGHHGQAHTGDFVGGEFVDTFTAKPHVAALAARQAEHGPHGGSFAHAVAAEQGGHLACLHLQIHTKQHLAAAVGRLQTLDFQQSAHAGAPSCSSSPR